VASENVELVRRGWEHLDRTGEIDPELLDPEVEWGTLLETYHGPDGVREWVQTLNESFEDLRVELEEAAEVGDQVVSVAVVRGRARLTGIDGEVRFANLWTFSEGRVVRCESFQTLDEAMRAAEGD
jgi:ketosteroid isomerase-like protein